MKAIDPGWAWEAFEAGPGRPWDLKKVGHLYRRAVFGSTWNELRQGLELGPEKAIDKLLAGGPGLKEFEAETLRWGESIRKTNNGPQASAWWLYRMLHTPHPLREKMTLFWHNRFATSNAKVQSTRYMLGQYDLLYANALESFAVLLEKISKDPAMLVWLDTVQSKKGMPNENYARELMELFSLGIGNYTEKDIREAARAFTGWEIVEGKFHKNAKEHDAAAKAVLGKTGMWDGEDIVSVCLEQKSCPRFITKKLYRFLISESTPPAPELIEPLAAAFAKNFNFGKLVERMLRSNLFFSEHAYRQCIKSPVDFALGSIRALELRQGTLELASTLETLGQNVFNPPSVKGWDGGSTWLNGQTLLSRNNFSLTVCEAKNTGKENRPSPVLLAARHKKVKPAEQVDFFVDLFLQGDVPAESLAKIREYAAAGDKRKYPLYWSEQEKAETKVTSLCHLVLALPEYQIL